MTIHLPPDIERSIQAAVHSGQFASVDDAMTKAASLLLERLKHEQPQAVSEKAAANEERTALPRKPIWERILERSAAIPDEEWISCRSMVPSSMTITSTARRSGHRRHEAVVCRRHVLDSHRQPQRSVAR